MSLPQDFDSVLAEVQKRGILRESPEAIESRLALAIQSTALKSGQRELGDLGLGDWTLGVLRRMEKALHDEMCDLEKKALKEDYKNLLEAASSPKGITAVSAVVAAILSTINPAFVASNVIIYFSLWLLKRGLNRWCSLPVESE
jgi:hypothetical protein